MDIQDIHDAIVQQVNAERVQWTAQVATKDIRFGRGRKITDAIEDSPLFGGQRQGDLFSTEGN